MRQSEPGGVHLDKGGPDVGLKNDILILFSLYSFNFPLFDLLENPGEVFGASSCNAISKPGIPHSHAHFFASHFTRPSMHHPPSSGFTFPPSATKILSLPSTNNQDNLNLSFLEKEDQKKKK